jgi:hypothetical protein
MFNYSNPCLSGLGLHTHGYGMVGVLTDNLVGQMLPRVCHLYIINEKKRLVLNCLLLILHIMFTIKCDLLIPLISYFHKFLNKKCPYLSTINSSYCFSLFKRVVLFLHQLLLFPHHFPLKKRRKKINSLLIFFTHFIVHIQ